MASWPLNATCGLEASLEQSKYRVTPPWPARPQRNFAAVGSDGAMPHLDGIICVRISRAPRILEGLDEVRLDVGG
jgi:hypothetical protein